MNLFNDIERRIDEQLRKLFRQPGASTGREAVEIQELIADDVRSRVQVLPRGRRIFPYHEAKFRLLAEDEARRAALYAMFVEGNALQQSIENFLRSDEIEFPAELQVTVEIVDTIDAYNQGPFASYHVRERQEAEATQQHEVELTSSNGLHLILSNTRIQVGRSAEVRDDRRRLVRRNDVVIDHNTVSRAHAHIEYSGGEYRLFDDGSSYGTSVIHEGRLVELPKAGGRGMKLSPGDEIYFGQVLVRFDMR